MNAYRKNAITTGVLFIVATVAGVISVPLLQFLDEPGYLTEVNENGIRLITSSLLLIIMAFACAGIAIWLYPVLKRHHETLALGAVGFRLTEAIFHIIAIFGIIPVIALSREYIHAGTGDAIYFQTIGIVLKSVRDLGSQIGLIAWCIGALMYYIVFYQSGLIPQWLSVWGIIAVIPALTAVSLSIYHVLDPMSSVHTLMNIPIALQEMVLALWLIVKGFNTTAITPGASDR